MKFFKLPASHSLFQNLAIISVVALAVYLTENLLALLFLILIPSLPAVYGNRSRQEPEEREAGDYDGNGNGFGFAPDSE